MSVKMSIGFLFIVLSIGIQQILGDGVKCYVCQSLTESGCADPFSAGKTTQQDNCSACSKVVTDVPLIGTTVVRSCDATCSEEGFNAGVVGSNKYCCTGNLCNSGAIVNYNIAFMLSLLLMKLVL